MSGQYGLLPPPEPTLANVECEAALLGAMMIDNRVIDTAAVELLPQHFYEPLHGRIYKVLRLLREAGDAATPITARAYFESDPGMKELGGPSYLAALTGSGAGLIGARTFIDQLLMLAMQRELRQALRDGVESINESIAGKPGESFAESWNRDDPADPAEIAADISANILRLTQAKARNQPKPMSSVLKHVRARHERAQQGESIGAICKSIEDINTIITAAAPKQMTIIGGRPGMGKTVLLCSACWGYAVNGHATLLISLEMNEEQLALRMAADLTFAMNEPVPYRSLVKDEVSESELLTVDEAQRRIAAYPLNLVCPGRVTIEQIDGIVAREVARLKRLGLKLEVVGLDYVQIVAATGRLEGTARINHISEGLLGIGDRYDCHVIALSQLLRDIDKRPDPRPTAADLKESGRLEEDATNVLLAYRPEKYLLSSKPARDDKGWDDWDIEYQAARGRCDIIGAKTRTNEPQTRRVKFYGANQAIRSSDFVEPTYKHDRPLLPDPDQPAHEEDGAGFGS